MFKGASMPNLKKLTLDFGNFHFWKKAVTLDVCVLHISCKTQCVTISYGDYAIL